MELSAIVKEYNLPLTRPERNMVSQLDTDVSAASENRYKQQMKELAAAREAVKQLPDRQTSERQNNMARAAMLKERLKTLRQMIPFLSPSASKSLKVEMQQVAAQIASLEGGRTSGTGSTGTATETPDANSSESGNETTSPQDSAVQQDATAQGADEARPEQPVSSDGAAQEYTQKSSTYTSDDHQMKDAVEELKSLYNTVMAALKRKQQTGQGIERQADLSPTLRVYAVTQDNSDSIVVKV